MKVFELKKLFSHPSFWVFSGKLETSHAHVILWNARRKLFIRIYIKKTRLKWRQKRRCTFFSRAPTRCPCRFHYNFHREIEKNNITTRYKESSPNEWDVEGTWIPRSWFHRLVSAYYVYLSIPSLMQQYIIMLMTNDEHSSLLLTFYTKAPLTRQQYTQDMKESL